ncbi:MAG: Rieske (2Fe-2S) protein [Bryobacteraceae bacterium]|jgi:cytochrome b6-f complex iron-sulfur subunit
MSDEFTLDSKKIVAASGEDLATRRLFLGVASAASLGYAAAIGYPVYRYLASPIEESAMASAVTEVALRDAQKLPPGSALMFKFGSQPAMLIHHRDTTWTALGAVCTHLGCTVQYVPARDVIHCNCHGGEYDPHTGQNISGPPPRPLKRYVVKLTDEAAVVSRA